jgi:hypothetical protein
LRQGLSARRLDRRQAREHVFLAQRHRQSSTRDRRPREERDLR